MVDTNYIPERGDIILTDHLKSLDWRARKVKFVEKAPPQITEQVLAKLKTLVS